MNQSQLSKADLMFLALVSSGKILFGRFRKRLTLRLVAQLLFELGDQVLATPHLFDLSAELFVEVCHLLAVFVASQSVGDMSRDVGDCRGALLNFQGAGSPAIFDGRNPTPHVGTLVVEG